MCKSLLQIYSISRGPCYDIWSSVFYLLYVFM